MWMLCLLSHWINLFYMMYTLGIQRTISARSCLLPTAASLVSTMSMTCGTLVTDSLFLVMALSMRISFAWLMMPSVTLEVTNPMLLYEICTIGLTCIMIWKRHMYLDALNVRGTKVKQLNLRDCFTHSLSQMHVVTQFAWISWDCSPMMRVSTASWPWQIT